jgi:hypothetical protein
MSEALQDLLDNMALNELIYSRLHAMDARDWVAYRAGLLDDAEFDFTDHGVATDKAAEIMKGADYFVTILQSVIDGFDATQHHATNLLHQVNGDTAESSSYVYAEHFLSNDRGDPSVTCGGRYKVTSQRTTDGWKVKKWRFETSWFRGNTMLYKLATDAAGKKAQDEAGR